MFRRCRAAFFMCAVLSCVDAPKGGIGKEARAPLVVPTAHLETPQVIFPALAQQSDDCGVKVEVAKTKQAIEQGLMFRSFLGEHAGMLFVFPAPAKVQFWMKNTYVPLDMIFMDADRNVVGLAEDAKPLDDKTLLGPALPAQYVLEVRAGYVKRCHLTMGMQATFIGLNK